MARVDTTIAPADLQAIRDGQGLHLDHHGTNQVAFAQVSGNGMTQSLVALEGPNQGKRYEVMDASGSYGSACLGAGHPLFAAQFPSLWASSGCATDELGSQFRSRFLNACFGHGGPWADRFPTGEYRVSGRSSGSEGMELALRLVLESRWDCRRLAPHPDREGRRVILAFEGAWHGWTPGAQALTNRRHYRLGLPDALQEGPWGCKVQFLPFAEPGLLEGWFSEHGPELAAVFVEPVQGDAGILVPPPGYLRTLEQLCHHHGALLVADEVLTFGKTGQFFAMTDEQGPIPTDITVIGKSIGFGIEALSLVIARKGLAVRPSGAVATRDLRPLTCALVHAGLDYLLAEHLLERSAQLGQALHAGLRAIASECPEVFREVRGLGYLQGMELTEPAAQALPNLRRCLVEKGVWVEFMAGAGRRSHGLRYLLPTLRIAPPLIATADDLDRILTAIQTGTRAFKRDI